MLHGTASGAVHRGWIRVKDTLGGTNDPDLLEDCERFEVQALRRLRAEATDELLTVASSGSAFVNVNRRSSWPLSVTVITSTRPAYRPSRICRALHSTVLSCLM